ncbi:hypothetical protein ACLQ2M_41480, partial [Streptomyces sp. DT7]
MAPDPGFRSRFRREITVAAVLYRVKYVEADLTEVPEGLRAVLEECLTADPAARHTAAALAGLLAPGAADGWPAPV